MNSKLPIIIVTALILLSAAALILYFNLSKRNIRLAEEYAASAEALLLSGDYSGAVTECAVGLRHYPENTGLYILKSRAYLLSEDTAKAFGTLDYGYKQTGDKAILEYRAQLPETPVEDAEFLPLTEPGNNTADNPGSQSSEVIGSGNSENSGTSGNRETYRSDTPIKVTIPNVTPPPEPSVPEENNEVSLPETSNVSGEDKTSTNSNF